MKHFGCPDAEDLRRYTLGSLSEEQAEQLEDHLQGCQACEATFVSLEDATDVILEGVRRSAGDAQGPPDSVLRAAIEKAKSLVSGDVASAPPAELPPIEQIGPYRLVEKLGQGGMGTVYRAVHTRLEKPVAIKILATGPGRSAEFAVRFEQEMRAIGRLSHPYLVQAFDAGETVDKRFLFLTMELVEGQDVARLVEQQGRLPLAQACQIIRQAAEGLEYVHQQMRVHRDIKPSNLMLTPTGTVKILDLGLALLGDRETGTLTGSDLAMGTPEYMAPEQATDSHQVDVRADIYSLGCTFYKLLTGKAPYPGQTVVQIVMKHQQTPIPSLREERPDVPAALDAVFRKMLAKRPDDRQPSMAAVIAELDACLDPSSSAIGLRTGGPQVSATSRSAVAARLLQPLRSHPLVASAVGLSLAFIVLLAAVLIRIRHADNSETTLRVPDGAQVHVDRHGDVSVTMPASGSATGPAPPLAVAPFDAKQARTHQAAWAKYLGVPVEMTNSIGMKFVLIPPGEFLMGSTAEEQAAAIEGIRGYKDDPLARETVAWEGPQHRVRISRAFYLGVYRVTQAEYERVMGANPSAYCTKPLPAEALRPPLSEPARNRRADASSRILPGTDTSRYAVDSISWTEAQEFCRRLAALPAEQALNACYRLPTEAQWEYACRAGTTTPWHSGSDPEQANLVGWFLRNSNNRPRPVGELAPNAWGLYDMHGRLPQWCADGWDPDYYAHSPTLDPPGGLEQLAHIYRGCGHASTPFHGRSASRGREWATGKRGSVLPTFRVLLEIAAPATTPAATSSPLTPAGEGPGVRGPAPPLAVAPFDAQQARAHQTAWAKRLGVPVETTNSIGMKFTLIPPGEFMMGSTPEEQAWATENIKKDDPNPMSWRRVPLEGPQHRVQISRAFYLGVYDVTQEQYERLMGVNPSAFAAKPLAGAAFKPPLNDKEQRSRDELSNRVVPGTDTRRFAVDTVLWDEADEFCRRLTALPAEQAKGARYRLPTEAQWEYACRAGTITPWHNGSDPEQALRVGWFLKNSRPHEVGELAPNAWGLYDLHGARPQWCADCYDRDFYVRSPVVDPYCTSGTTSHVFRGGEGLTPYHGRSACRGFASESGSRMTQTSFRVLLEIAPPAEKPAASSSAFPLAGAGPTTPRSPLPPTTDAVPGEGPGVRGSTPSPAVAPFDAQQARLHQATWAKHLGLPVEVTNSLGMKFVLIPPGEFMMGSTPAEQTWAAEEIRKANSDAKFIALEGPQHRVQLSRAFYLGLYHVTQGEYERLMGVNPSAFTSKPVDGAALRPPLPDSLRQRREAASRHVLPGTDTSRYPVDSVLWQEADEFCRRLNAVPEEQAGRRRYRLPTEAQWEYACRAGTTTAWCNGSDPEQALRVGWFWANANAHPHPVGELAPNAWGLYDMHGNIKQWCADGFETDYYARSPLVDPPGAANAEHVYRGGALGFVPFHGRSASRCFIHDNSARVNFIGFRVLLEIAP